MEKPRYLATIAVLLGFVLTGAAQDAGVLPLTQAMRAHSSAYGKALEPNREVALAEYKQNMAAVAADGASIYRRSCAFCHGENGDGEGAEAMNLKVKPEVLQAIRGEREYLTRKLAEGVRGSAMPYFSVYTRDRVDSIVDYLDARYQVLGAPQPPTLAIGPEALAEAGRIYAGNCARCHGEDGRGGTTLSKDYLPAPPDFTKRSLNAGRAAQVIEAGYPGTMMGAYGQLPPEVREGLAAKVQGFYGRTADSK